MPSDRQKTFLPGLIVLVLGLAGILWLYQVDLHRERPGREGRGEPSAEPRMEGRGEKVEGDPSFERPGDPQEIARDEPGSLPVAPPTEPRTAAESSLPQPLDSQESFEAPVGRSERSADARVVRPEVSSAEAIPNRVDRSVAPGRSDQAEARAGTPRPAARSERMPPVESSLRGAAVPGSGVYVAPAAERSGAEPSPTSPETQAAVGEPAGGDVPKPKGGAASDLSDVKSTMDEDRPVADEPQEEAEIDSIPVVRVIPSAFRVSVGDQVSAIVSISGARNVGHVPFHMIYDPRVLQFEYGEEGPFLGSDGNQTAFFAAPSSAGDAVVVGLSRLGRIPGVSGGGQLCVLHFSVVGTGQTPLGFSRAKVRDSGNQIVDAIFESAAVSSM